MNIWNWQTDIQQKHYRHSPRRAIINIKYILFRETALKNFSKCSNHMSFYLPYLMSTTRFSGKNLFSLNTLNLIPLEEMKQNIPKNMYYLPYWSVFIRFYWKEAGPPQVKSRKVCTGLPPKPTPFTHKVFIVWTGPPLNHLGFPLESRSTVDLFLEHRPPFHSTLSRFPHEQTYWLYRQRYNTAPGELSTMRYFP